MLLIKTGQDNTISCTAAQLLPPAYAGTTQYIVYIYNKVFNYTFTLNDTGAYPARYNTLYLPQADLAGVNAGDYTYNISIAALPGLVLDAGKLRIYTAPDAPIAYTNATEQNTAYIAE